VPETRGMVHVPGGRFRMGRTDSHPEVTPGRRSVAFPVCAVGTLECTTSGVT
jgi:formylglycine-generating enzyme required for sulfatase activity